MSFKKKNVVIPIDWCVFVCVCVCVQTQCQDLRKRKNLELQILSEPVRAWEGDSMKSLGHVAYMSQVHLKNGSSEVRDMSRVTRANISW